jgi:hypothetical protein
LSVPDHFWDLFLILQNALNMTSTLVRGLPYVTMTYEKTSAMTEDGRTILPTIAAELAVGRNNKPIADAKNAIDCTTASSLSDKPTSFRVERDVELYFPQSDYTWIAFFSHPVWVQCISNEADTESGGTFLQVVDVDKRNSDNSTFMIRTAMLNRCTTGSNPMSCRQGLGHLLPQEISTKAYGQLLRRHAKIYPGRATFMDYEIDETLGVAKLILDWDVQTMGEVTSSSDDAVSSSPPPPGLLMFALPHHLDKLSPKNLPDNTVYCTSSLMGPTCLVEGASWTITEDLPTVGFRAPRPPKPEFLPGISKALKNDINYTLPHFFRRGAGDTYFSGKMLARLARILIVAEEAQELCQDSVKSAKSQSKVQDGYTDVCVDLALPSAKEQSAALDRLRQGVQVWIDGTAETPFVYDSAWGGIVSCGCQFEGHGCKNRVPDCPAFLDQGLNFGNGACSSRRRANV